MRTVLINFLVLQLLFQGVAVPHSHLREFHPDSVKHDMRPHVHLSGHHNSHAHHPTHHASQPASPAVPGSNLPRHDEDAVYVGNEVLMASAEREHVPELARFGWMCAVDGLLATAVSSPATSRLNSGPPVEHPTSALKLLPHLLRV